MDQFTFGLATSPRFFVDAYPHQCQKKLYCFPTIWHIGQRSEFFQAFCGFRKDGVSTNEGQTPDRAIDVFDDPDDWEAFSLFAFGLW